jgi:hypothetical protein
VIILALKIGLVLEHWGFGAGKNALGRKAVLTGVGFFAIAPITFPWSRHGPEDASNARAELIALWLAVIGVAQILAGLFALAGWGVALSVFTWVLERYEQLSAALSPSETLIGWLLAPFSWLITHVIMVLILGVMEFILLRACVFPETVSSELQETGKQALLWYSLFVATGFTSAYLTWTFHLS